MPGVGIVLMQYVYTDPHRHDLRVFMCSLVTFANLNILVIFFHI